MKKLIALLLAVVLVLGLVACGGSTETTTTASETTAAAETATSEATTETAGEATEEATATEETASAEKITLTVGTPDPLGGFLIGATQGTCEPAKHLVYDPLFLMDYDTGEMVPCVIKDDYYFEDDTTLVMHVREGITFSDGTPLTGKDILASYLWYSTEADISSQWTALDVENSYTEDDDMTVVLKLKSAFGPCINLMCNTGIFSAAFIEENGYDSELWYTAPLGSGPYVVSEYVYDSHVTMTLRDDYWGMGEFYDNDNVETVVLQYYGELSTMYMALENGEIDVACAIDPTDYNRAVNGESEGVTAKMTYNGDITYFCMEETENEILGDIRVRQALAYGVDWAAVGKAAYDTMWIQATSMISSSNKQYYEDIGGTYEFDQEKAKALIEETGYTADQLTFDFVCMAQPEQQTMSEAVQYYASQIGITINLEYLDFAAAIECWIGGGTDFNFQSTESGSVACEPHLYLNLLIAGACPFGVVSIDDPKVEELFAATYSTYDTAERKAAWTALEQYIYDNVYAIPMIENTGALAWNSSLIADIQTTSDSDVNLRNIIFN